MSPEEMRQFEASAQDDPQLMSELSFLAEVNEAIGENDTAQFRETVKSIVSRRQRLNSGRIRTYAFMRYASVILIAVLAGTGIWYFTDKEEDEDLFEMYYKPYSEMFIERSADTNAQSKNAARVLYQQGFYQQAYVEAHDQLTTHPEDTDTRFYLGVTALELNHPEEAITQLKKLETATSSTMLPQIKWYLALAYLKQHDTEDAKVLFKELSATQNIYRSHAKEILKKIR